MNLPLNFVYVALGGALGASSRYAMSLLLAGASPRFPLATLSVNLLGAFGAGLLLVWFLNKGAMGSPLQLLLMVGFLGGFTTFSAFSVETLKLAQEGEHWLLFGNIVLNVFGSLLAVCCGALLGRVITSA